MNHDEFKKRIPGDLLTRVEQVESRFRLSHSENDRKIAAFDMDNTLLIGDVGDALFAQLKIDERDSGVPLSIDHKKIPLTWLEFKTILEEKGKETAYPLMTTAMVGIPVQTVLDATRRAVYSKDLFLVVEEEEIPVPAPNPVTRALVFYLKSLGYEIFIISATNQYSVEFAAKEFFDIPHDHVFGMKPATFRHDTYGEVIGDTIAGPITVESGKVEAYRKLAGAAAPLISAGDSATDIQVLNLTDPQGLIVWVEKPSVNDKLRQSVVLQLTYPEILYFLKQNF